MVAVPSGSLRLLPVSAVVPTSPIDHPDWNYRPLLGRVQRLRFRMVVELLGGERFGRLLEVGFGSGVFLPELARHCDGLYGIDAHPTVDEVAGRLAAHGVRASLVSGSAELLPYDEGFFDAVVAVSTLEYVPDVEAACRQIRRVLRPGGTLVLATPGAGRLWNLALHVVTRQGPSQYGDRRERLQPTLRRHFRAVREVRVPSIGGAALRLYTGLRMVNDGPVR